MVIRLTKNYKKPSGKTIPKGTIIEVVKGMVIWIHQRTNWHLKN